VTTPITISKDDLEEIVKNAVQQAFRDVGLHTDEAEHLEDARADIRFLRRLRLSVDGLASKIGTAIILALVTGLITLIGLGARSFIGK